MRIIQAILPGILLLQVVYGVEQYRLPKDIQPTHYKIKLYADPKKPNFSGNVEITFNIVGKNGTDHLLLHAPAEYISIKKITYGSSKCIINSKNHITDIITISCDSRFVSGTTIALEYKGKFATNDLNGVYKSTYDNGKVLLATQFKPIYARRAFPCFDELSFKSTFEFTIVHPSSYKALSNAVTSQITSNGDETTTLFKRTPKMPTYQLAFIISQLEPALATTSRNNVYARKDELANLGIFIKNGKALFDIFSGWAQLPLDQMLQVAIPEPRAAAMGNYGLITHREIDVLDEGNRTSEFEEQRILKAIAYQMCYQWFGNYVTLDWWSNTWLNEGMAIFQQYYAANYIYNRSTELDKQFLTEVLHKVLLEDALPSAQPLSVPESEVNSPTEIKNRFDVKTNSKGACIVRMVKTILGREVFPVAMIYYLASNHNSTVNPDKFIESLQYAVGDKVENFAEKLKNWIYKAGFPLVTVTQKNDSVITLKQESFVKNDDTEWYVPITYTDSKEKSFLVEIKGWLEPHKTFEIRHSKEDWFILNIQQVGFFRVNYDNHLWDNIIKALKGDDMKSIDPLNKAHIIDDIFNLARFGRVEYKKAFDLIRYLKDEIEYHPWNAAFNAFKYLIERVDNKTEKLLKNMIRKLLTGAFPQNTAYTTHIDKLKEQLVLEWACKVGQEECLNFAIKSFQDYKNSKSDIENSKRETVFCYGLKSSENVREDYDFLFDVYKKSTSRIEQKDVLESLGCVEDENLLAEYLALTITKNSFIRQQDYVSVFTTVYSNNKLGVDVALEFLETNFAKIEKSYGGVEVLSSLMANLANKLKTDEQIGALRKILQDHNEIELIKVLEENVIDVINANKKWTSNYKSDMH